MMRISTSPRASASRSFRSRIASRRSTLALLDGDPITGLRTGHASGKRTRPGRSARIAPMPHTILMFDVDGTLVLSGGAGARALERALLAVHGISGGMQGIRPGGMTDPAIV